RRADAATPAAPLGRPLARSSAPGDDGYNRNACPRHLGAQVGDRSTARVPRERVAGRCRSGLSRYADQVPRCLDGKRQRGGVEARAANARGASSGRKARQTLGNRSKGVVMEQQVRRYVLGAAGAGFVLVWTTLGSTTAIL